MRLISLVESVPAAYGGMQESGLRNKTFGRESGLASACDKGGWVPPDAQPLEHRRNRDEVSATGAKHGLTTQHRLTVSWPAGRFPQIDHLIF